MGHVLFLSATAAARWIRDHGAASIMAGLVERLEADFARWPEFDAAPRLASHSPVGVIELMPVSDGFDYTFKYVNGHPANPAHGLQTVTAFGVVADVTTGYPRFVAEMTLLTALRTAATSALAARHLARPDSQIMAMIGTGSQAEFQALALRETLGVSRLRIWDTDPRAMAKFIRNIEPLGFEIHVASSAADAADGADVITTCTADKRRAIVLDDSMVEPGVHVNAIGGDCPGKTELDPAILRRAEIFVEYEPQTRAEGEIQALATDHPVTELWQVIADRSAWVRRPEAITVFDSVGFAIEDFTVLRFAEEAAGAVGLLEPLDLLASPDDPKDLFGLVMGVDAPLPTA